MSNIEQIQVKAIVSDDRIRSDMGDIIALAASIKEFGIIQPIVLNKQGTDVILVAGGRRLTAVKALGWPVLLHGRDYVWRDEPDDAQRQLRLQAVEVEENVRRKDLSWPEVVLGKQRLLKIMQEIHGEPVPGRPKQGPTGLPMPQGFGANKLAALLGEPASVTLKDLGLARLVTQFPELTKMPTKNDALRRLNVATTVAGMQNAAAAIAALPQKVGAPAPTKWTLYEGDFQKNIANLGDGSVDLVCSDLPYNIGLGDSTASHAAGLAGFGDSMDDAALSSLYEDVARETFRILHDDRFAVFFFGFESYVALITALRSVGFVVDNYPFIWKRDRSAPPNAYARYAKTYDPALICSKGSPTFIRSGSANFIDVPSVRGADRLQAAQKPLAVMERFILDMTAEGSHVVDLMAGSGSTGVAALTAKRRVTLFEREPAACQIIKARMGSVK